MKRYTASLSLSVVSESPESLHFLLATLVDRLNKKPPGVRFPDVGMATMKRAKLTRVRSRGRA